MFVLRLLCLFVITPSSYGHKTEAKYALQNKHLKVVAEPWKPFFVFYCPDGTEKNANERCATNGEETYGGALWDFLMLVKDTRNVTLSILRAPDKSWGVCYGKDNCTGMIGMVNRREVDFGIGR